jgi:release factor glutamine methyltransferase
MTDALVTRLRAAGCVFAEDEAALLRAAVVDPDELERMIAERVSGVPLEHVLGWVDFAGIRLRLGPGVFVPRPRSEFLVTVAVAELHPGDVLGDLCGSCGAVGLAVADRMPVRLHLAELDPVALDWARVNAGDSASVHEGDLYDALPDDLRGAVDLITVVAPYVPTGDLPLLPHEARDFEPARALDGGADGLELIRRIAADAPLWLASGGVLLAEVAEHQAHAAADILTAAGLASTVIVGLDGETIVRGSRSSP